jgi:hypothetical protein
LRRSIMSRLENTEIKISSLNLRAG